MNTKQLIIIRKDLGMRKGKMVVQGAHASLSVILKMMNVLETKDGYTYTLQFPKGSSLDQWLNGIFTKICVSVDSEQELISIYDQAKIANLPCSLIQDNGLTEFNGVKTYTAVAIGPAEENKIDSITGKLKLL